MTDAGTDESAATTDQSIAAEPEPVVRLATLDDAPTIADIYVRGWQTAYRGFVPDVVLDGLSVEEHTRRWQEQLATSHDPAHDGARDPASDRGPRTWVVLDADASVVGFAIGGPGRDESAPSPPNAGEIYSIYLAPEARGHGYGRTVLAHATQDLLDRGFDPIVVWAFEGNATARRFYEAAGFRLEGTRNGVDFDGVVLPEIRYLLHRADR